MPDENQTEVETVDTNPEVETETAVNDTAATIDTETKVEETAVDTANKEAEIDPTPVPGLEGIIVAAITKAFDIQDAKHRAANQIAPVAAAPIEDGSANYTHVSVEKCDNGYLLGQLGKKATFFHGLDELLVHAESSFRKAFTK